MKSCDWLEISEWWKYWRLLDNLLFNHSKTLHFKIEILKWKWQMCMCDSRKIFNITDWETHQLKEWNKTDFKWNLNDEKSLWFIQSGP